MHGRGRCVDRRGDLIIGQTAEIMQLYDLSQARFHLLQSLEGVVECNDVEIHRRQHIARLIRNARAAAATLQA